MPQRFFEEVGQRNFLLKLEETDDFINFQLEFIICYCHSRSLTTITHCFGNFTAVYMISRKSGTKLAGLGGCSTTYYEGRPQKLFNLVRIVHIPMYYSFWSLHGQLLFMNLTTRALSFMGKMCLLWLSTSHSRL